jgi:hypothetical protein
MIGSFGYERNTWYSFIIFAVKRLASIKYAPF